MTRQISRALVVALFTASLLASARLLAAQEGEKQKPATENSDKNTADQIAPDWLQVTTQPAQLRPTAVSITLRQDGDSRAVYEAIGKQAGIRVLFDPDYVPRAIHVDINKARLTE